VPRNRGQAVSAVESEPEPDSSLSRSSVGSGGFSGAPGHRREGGSDLDLVVRSLCWFSRFGSKRLPYSLCHTPHRSPLGGHRECRE
jgi:hypothetical protein